MTGERLAETIAEIDKYRPLQGVAFEEYIARDIALSVVGIAIEVDAELTEEERDKARQHYFQVRPPRSLLLGPLDPFEE